MTRIGPTRWRRPLWRVEQGFFDLPGKEDYPIRFDLCIYDVGNAGLPLTETAMTGLNDQRLLQVTGEDPRIPITAFLNLLFPRRISIVSVMGLAFPVRAQAARLFAVAVM